MAPRATHTSLLERILISETLQRQMSMELNTPSKLIVWQNTGNLPIPVLYCTVPTKTVDWT